MPASGPNGSEPKGSPAFATSPDPAASRSFPPEVALHLVKMACERPDDHGRSLSSWDCREMARQLAAEGIIPSISPDTVRRVLEHHHLKPWRHHLWLSPKVPRDAAFAASVQEICDLYTRPLREDEMVLCVDEKTNLQPRPRKASTLAAQPERPV